MENNGGDTKNWTSDAKSDFNNNRNYCDTVNSNPFINLWLIGNDSTMLNGNLQTKQTADWVIGNNSKVRYF